MRGIGGTDDRSDLPGTLAVRFLTDAKEYLQTARALEHIEDRLPAGPYYFLLCHAIELVLKSFLATRGATEEQLTKRFGHKLLKAYKRAQTRGLSPSDPRIPEIIEWMHPFHEGMVFRYRQTGSKRLPAFGELLDAVASLIGDVEPVVRDHFRSVNKLRS